MLTKIKLGQGVWLQGTFKNEAGAQVDPTVVQVVVKNPDGSVTVLSAIVSLVVGVHKVYFKPLVVGLYSWAIKGSGNYDIAGESLFVVESSVE